MLDLVDVDLHLELVKFTVHLPTSLCVGVCVGVRRWVPLLALWVSSVCILKQHTYLPWHTCVGLKTQFITGYCEVFSRPIERTIPSIIINTGNLVYKRTAHFVSMASWSKDNTLQFIELYRRNECLWRVKCKEYSNRIKSVRIYFSFQKPLLRP